jgi:hypothetical protein
MKEPAKNQELKRRSFNSLLWIIFLGPVVKGRNWFYDFWEPLLRLKKTSVGRFFTFMKNLQFQVTQTRTRGQLPVNLQSALGSQLPFSQNSWFQVQPNIGQEQLFGFPRPDPWFI